MNEESGWGSFVVPVQLRNSNPGKLRQRKEHRGVHPIWEQILLKDILRRIQTFLFMPELPVVLLAEDSEDDVIIFRKEMSKASIDFPLFVTKDGEETIAYLKGAGKFGNRSEFPVPDLLLLDLVMPEITGFEVLEWIRDQPGLASLPVVVLTSSETIHDIKLANQLGARSYLVKPLKFKDLLQLNCVLPANKSLRIASHPAGDPENLQVRYTA